MIWTVIIFTATFFVLAAGRLPGLRIDRTGAAIVGATLMVASGALTMDEAWAAINHDTILLLFGMMIVVANLRLSGAFRLVGAWVMRHAHRPLALLISIILVSGILSTFFVNDTICLILTPLVLEVAVALRRNPVPYLLGVATASNIGSACTITGNPQNMIIGALSKIPYATFVWTLAPVSLAGLAIAAGVIWFFYRAEFRNSELVEVPEERIAVHRGLLIKSLAVSAGMIGFFFAGWPVAQVALVAGTILLITRRVKPEKVYRQIDFALLAMFCGLFIVVAAMEKTGLDREVFLLAQNLQLDRVPVMTGLAVVLSNLVSNVPAVLIFKPVMPHLADPQRGWLTLAMASTFAGNTTIVASVANLIVVERARRIAPISFWDYLRVGLPITGLTLATGVVWLSWR